MEGTWREWLERRGGGGQLEGKGLEDTREEKGN